MKNSLLVLAVLFAAVPSFARLELVSRGQMTCAADDEQVKCWGQKTGAVTQAPFGRNFHHIKKIAVGNSHACAIDDDGLWCWGDQTEAVPAQITHPTDVAISSNGITCVVQDSKIECWGGENEGFFSDFISKNNKDVSWIGLYDQNLCVLSGEEIRCNQMGYSDNSPLLDGVTDPSRVFLGNNVIMAKVKTSPISYDVYGNYVPGRATVLPKFPPGLTYPEQVAFGYQHACALQRGRVFCWGPDSNRYFEFPWLPFQIPYPTYSLPVAKMPYRFKKFDKATAVSAGIEFSCAGAAIDKITCWGDNSAQQLVVPK